MVRESISCQRCGAPFSERAIENAIFEQGARIIACDHCGASMGYTPNNSVYSTVDDAGTKKIANEMELSRLDRLEQWNRESVERMEREDRESMERMWERLRIKSARPVPPVKVYIELR